MGWSDFAANFFFDFLVFPFTFFLQIHILADQFSEQNLYIYLYEFVIPFNNWSGGSQNITLANGSLHT